MDMKKIVLKLNIHDNKDKQKVMRAVSSLTGIELLSVDIKESKMTIVGEVDPVDVVGKLRKQWGPEIVTVGPAKEEKKPEENKKEKEKENAGQVVDFNKLWQGYYRPNYPYNYHVRSMEEDPNSCVIS